MVTLSVVLSSINRVMRLVVWGGVEESKGAKGLGMRHVVEHCW